MDRTYKILFDQGNKPTSYPCFAGKEDELLVYSKENQVLIWQLPSPGGRGHRTVDSPFLELDGHQDRIVASLCFHKNIEALASGDANEVIKLWVSKETN